MVNCILIIQGYDSSHGYLHGLLLPCHLQITFVCMYSSLAIYGQGQCSEWSEGRAKIKRMVDGHVEHLTSKWSAWLHFPCQINNQHHFIFPFIWWLFSLIEAYMKCQKIGKNAFPKMLKRKDNFILLFCPTKSTTPVIFSLILSAANLHICVAITIFFL